MTMPCSFGGPVLSSLLIVIWRLIRYLIYKRVDPFESEHANIPL